MKKHMISLLIVLVLLSGILSGCKKQSNINGITDITMEKSLERVETVNNTTASPNKDNISFKVIKTIKCNDDTKYDFEYNSSNNSVVVTVSTDSTDDYSILLFVNNDGVITSMYEIRSAKQTTLFEETKENYPVTAYNDAGGIKSIEYDNLKVNFTYNNYIDNKLTAISYCEWDDSVGWSTILTGIYYTDTFDHYFNLVEHVDYAEIIDSRYHLFSNHMFFFSMLSQLSMCG